MAQKYATAREPAKAGLANILSTNPLLCLESREQNCLLPGEKNKQTKIPLIFTCSLGKNLMWKTSNKHIFPVQPCPYSGSCSGRDTPSHFVQATRTFPGSGIVTRRPMELVHNAHPAQQGLIIQQGCHTGVSASLHAQKFIPD